VTPATTAWRAVFGSFIQYSEKMNSAVARMAATWADGVGHCFLNILSIRSVIRNPLTMFVMEANSAIAPRMRMARG